MTKGYTLKDLVVQYKNTRYQLKPPNGYGYPLRQAKITVAEDKTGNVTFRYKNREVPYTIGIQQRIPRNTKQVVTAKSFTERQVHIPAPDHPWRRGFNYM